MSWLDTFRQQHTDPAALTNAVAERLFLAHNISKGAMLVHGWHFLSPASQQGWKQRAERMLALDTPPQQSRNEM